MSKRRAKRKAPPKNYSPRDEARKFLPALVELLKSGVRSSDKLSVATLKAAELLVKLADIQSLPQKLDDEIEIRDVPLEQPEPEKASGEVPPTDEAV